MNVYECFGPPTIAKLPLRGQAKQALSADGLDLPEDLRRAPYGGGLTVSLTLPILRIVLIVRLLSEVHLGPAGLALVARSHVFPALTGSPRKAQ